MKTLKKEGCAFRNIGKNIYIPDCKISLASFVLQFHDSFARFSQQFASNNWRSIKSYQEPKINKKEEKCLLFLVLKYPHVSRRIPPPPPHNLSLHPPHSKTTRHYEGVVAAWYFHFPWKFRDFMLKQLFSCIQVADPSHCSTVLRASGSRKKRW